MKRRMLSVLLSLVMLLGLLPTAAMANGTTDVAKIGETGYATLQSAINAADANDEIVMLCNTAETGIKVASDDSVILDLGGFTLTGDILSNGTLTVKNGTIINENGSVSAIESCGDSANLTVEALTVTSRRHALRIEGGTATINSGVYSTLSAGGEQTTHALNAGGKGTTTVTIKDGIFNGIAASEGVTTADSGAAVCAQTGATVTINDGAFSGGQNDTLYISTNTDGKIIAKGGTYDEDPTAFVAEGFRAAATANNTWSITPIPYVAEVNGIKYESMDEAWDNAIDAETATITLLANAVANDLDYAVSLFGGPRLNIVLNLAGYKLTVNALNAAGEKLTWGIWNGILTIKNGTVETTGTLTVGPRTITHIEDVTFDGTIDPYNGTLHFESGTFEGTTLSFYYDFTSVTKRQDLQITAPQGYIWVDCSDDDTVYYQYQKPGYHKLVPYDVEFKVTPETATVVVKQGDTKIEPLIPGFYDLEPELEYTYTVSAPGYNAVGPVTIPAGTTGVITVNLPPLAPQSGSSSSSTKYPVIVEEAEDGEAESSRNRAERGDTVTITVTPDEGYELDTLIVTDSKGNEIEVKEKNGKFTFTMPGSKVFVEAAFTEIEETTKTFSDVPAGHPFAEAVAFASKRGIIEGYADGSFGLANPATVNAAVVVVSRTMGQEFYGATSVAKATAWAAEMELTTDLDLSGYVTREVYMILLWRAAGMPQADLSVLDQFSDRNDISEIGKFAMSWGVENGLIEGYSDGTVRPNAQITRGAMAAIAMRYMQLG